MKTSNQRKILGLIVMVLVPELAPATTLPIGLWHFDETSGSTAADSSGNGHTITLYGGYNHSSGELNDGITFNGSNGYGEANWGLLTGDADRSVSLWFQTTSTDNSTWVSWGDSAATSLSAIGIQDGRVGFIGNPEGDGPAITCTAAITTSDYADGDWHHLVLTYSSGLKTMELYLDGQLVHYVTCSNPTTASSNIYFGQSASGDDIFFDGSLDEVAIYDRAITAQEVLTLWGQGNYLQKMVTVTSPANAYGSDVTGTTTFDFVAPGLTSATVKCWQGGGTYGSDSTVATMSLEGEDGEGSFSFNPADYPHGPITIRITATDGTTSDTCYLQLYNTVGAPWNEGMPATAPSEAAGLSLLYADDFNTMPSIVWSSSSRTPTTQYYSWEAFSTIPFTDVSSPNNPFSQRDTYLHIQASTTKMTTGSLTSLIKTPYPLYMECRFISQDAPGTWPAFWTVTDGNSETEPTDEEDIIEADGGDGAHAPDAPFVDNVNSHEHLAGGAQNPIYSGTSYHISEAFNMSTYGGHTGYAGWAFTPHTYGMLVTASYTTYYLDNFQVGSKKTTPVSLTGNFNMMVDFAAGGWPIDFQRYGGAVDMYVDYIRLYGLPLGTQVPLVSQDIGTVGVAGSTNYSGGIFTVDGSGAGTSTADALQYGLEDIAGDCMLTGRAGALSLVSGGGSLDPNAAGGLMIRSDTTAGSAFVMVNSTVGNGLNFVYRSSSGGSLTSVSLTGTTGAYLRLTRVGNTFTGYTSPDQVTWTPVSAGPVNVTMGALAYAGLSVSSNNSSQLVSDTFDTVGIWNSIDIGTVAFSGSVTSTGSTYKVTGSGLGTSAADAFHFACQPASGNCTMTARPSALTVSQGGGSLNPYAQSGVMMRSDLTPGSAFVMMRWTAGAGYYLAYRTTAGGTTTSTQLTGAVGPYLRLTRVGNAFTGYSSADNITWTPVSAGSVTVTMPTSIYIGLPVTSHSTSQSILATFDTVSGGANY